MGFSLGNMLHQLLNAGHPQGQAQQAPQQLQNAQFAHPIGAPQAPFSQDAANRYNAHPEQFVGKNAVDPRWFGYPADNSGGLSVGGRMPVQPVDGYYPQGEAGVPFMDQNTGNYLQPAMHGNAQTSLNGIWQQPAGNPMGQNINTPQGSTGADPFGWQQLRY